MRYRLHWVVLSWALNACDRGPIGGTGDQTESDDVSNNGEGPDVSDSPGVGASAECQLLVDSPYYVAAGQPLWYVMVSWSIYQGRDIAPEFRLIDTTGDPGPDDGWIPGRGYTEHESYLGIEVDQLGDYRPEARLGVRQVPSEPWTWFACTWFPIKGSCDHYDPTATAPVVRVVVDEGAIPPGEANCNPLPDKLDPRLFETDVDTDLPDP